MGVKRYQTAAQFLKENQEMLEEKEAQNNLILGLALTLKKNEQYYGSNPNIYLSIVKKDEISLCCLQTPPKNLILCGSENYEDKDLEELCNYFVAEKIDIPGVNGSNQLVEKFLKMWSQMSGAQYKLRMNMRIYQLDHTFQVPISKGYLRKVDIDEISLLTDWVHRFKYEVFGENDLNGARAFTLKKVNKEELFVWDNDGPVSMAAVARPIANGISINYVYTPPEFRKMGYATSCVKSLSDEMLKKYSYCSLFTDLSNPTSNSIYQEIGYYPVDDYNEYEFI